jgi:hypothetical protein
MASFKLKIEGCVSSTGCNMAWNAKRDAHLLL